MTLYLFTVDVVVEFETDYIEAFENEDVSLCARIATYVSCAVGFNFKIDTFLDITEGN